jgi:hypothetical protein
MKPPRVVSKERPVDQAIVFRKKAKPSTKPKLMEPSATITIDIDQEGTSSSESGGTSTRLAARTMISKKQHIFQKLEKFRWKVNKSAGTSSELIRIRDEVNRIMSKGNGLEVKSQIKEMKVLIDKYRRI